jgi:2-oxoisovalerate dehydrogenase E2 component (dihydrolipoyl transacylase)
MSRFVFKMPDLGEGTVEAEVVAWHVKVGDVVEEDQVIADVMTEKATVEVSAPVGGRVVSITGEAGDSIAVGTELIVFETSADAAPAGAPAPESIPPSAPPQQPQAATARAAPPASPIPIERDRIMTSPAIRRRAKEAGIDLECVPGSGPGGRITRQDFDAYRQAVAQSPAAARGAAPPPGRMMQARSGTEEIKVIGLRRLIAQRMADAKRNIPHFAYVEEVDVTELEALRQHLNGRRPEGTPALTYLPFIVMALARVLEEFPQCNALHDAERNVIVRHRAVHAGIATQTPDGLKVPVVRNAEAADLWRLASEIRRVSDAARDGTAKKEELSGSTITVTSLGKLGGIVSTPVINAPEVAIVGVNKAVERPVVAAGAIAIRRMMNLSSSFDHRFVDGFDAAAMIQRLRESLEHPAVIFMPH